jgi:hypothetical protein
MIFFLSAQSASAQTVVNANDRGWYNSSGNHTPTNNNTYTGEYLSLVYRSYFRFTIPKGVTCVAAATLELEVERYYGNQPHTVFIHDVDAAHVPLLDTANGSGSGVAIHGDLGTGSLYGTVGGITNATVGSILSFTLPASALTDIENASGSDFAVGARVTSASTSSFWGMRFSGGNESRIHRLTFKECPDAPDLKASKDVEVFDPSSAGLYALPGNDVVNEGSGTVDADSMELIDKIPSNVTFYNGDMDDGGPETNPVAFADTGSGLTFNYAADVGYSNGAAKPANFAACGYSPSAGYDVNVTYVCINPKGTMAAGTPFPAFAVSFRARID